MFALNILIPVLSRTVRPPDASDHFIPGVCTSHTHALLSHLSASELFINPVIRTPRKRIGYFTGTNAAALSARRHTENQLEGREKKNRQSK